MATYESSYGSGYIDNTVLAGYAYGPTQSGSVGYSALSGPVQIRFDQGTAPVTVGNAPSGSFGSSPPVAFQWQAQASGQAAAPAPPASGKATGLLILAAAAAAILLLRRAR